MKESIAENSNCRRGIYKLETPDFPCLFCGICCSKFQPQLTLTEAHSLADKLGVSWERFRSEYFDPRWPGTQSYLLRHVNGACIFLHTAADKKQKLCLVNAIKPSCCLEWRQGIDRSECLEGLRESWNLTVDASGKICGYREKIQAFERFILAQKNPHLSK
jgi:hypothetical protein